jgi:hypothetical protein
MAFGNRFFLFSLYSCSGLGIGHFDLSLYSYSGLGIGYSGLSLYSYSSLGIGYYDLNSKLSSDWLQGYGNPCSKLLHSENILSRIRRKRRRFGMVLSVVHSGTIV